MQLARSSATAIFKATLSSIAGSGYVMVRGVPSRVVKVSVRMLPVAIESTNGPKLASVPVRAAPAIGMNRPTIVSWGSSM